MLTNQTVTWIVISVESREPIHLGGGHFHPNTASCEKCGQEIRWVATVKSSAGDVLKTGMDCAATLSGGPSLQELRRAQRRFVWGKQDAERRLELAARKQARRVLGAQNEIAYAALLADLTEIANFPGCRERDRDLARGIAKELRQGERAFDLLDWERAAVSSALRTARLPASRHVGKAGDRIKDVPVTFEGRHSWSSSFGWRSVYRFSCDDGAQLAWFTSSGLVDEIPGGSINEAVGARFLLSASVKKHGERDGVAQTEILRVKVLPQGSGHFYTVDPAATERNDRYGSVVWAASRSDVEAKFPDLDAVGPFASYQLAQDAMGAAWDADAAVAA